MTKQNTLTLLAEIAVARNNHRLLPEVAKCITQFKASIAETSAIKYPLAIIRAGRKMGFFYKNK